MLADTQPLRLRLESQQIALGLQLLPTSKLARLCNRRSIWTGIYYATFERLGFIVATTLFLLPMMAWFYRGKWVANIISAIAFSALTYWLFVSLDVRLPKGFLPF